MNKISSTQLFTLLIGVKTFNIICMTASADANRMAGAALSVLIQIAAALPMLYLYRQSGFSLKKHILLGRFGKLLYAAFFIIWGAVSFSNLWGVTKSVYFPINSSLTGAVILGAVCLYAASLGLKSISRYSTIMLGFIVFTLIVMISGAYSKAELSNFTPNATLPGIAKGALHDFSSSGELVMLFVLLDRAGENREKGAMNFFAGRLILTEVIFVIEIVVLGKIMSVTDYPFFSAGAFSQPFSIQRSDSLYMLVFTMLCVMTVTLQLILSASLIKEAFPKLRHSSLLSVVLMLGLSAATGILEIDFTGILGVLILLLSVIFPIIMYIKRRLSNEKGSNVHTLTDNAHGVQS